MTTYNTDKLNNFIFDQDFLTSDNIRLLINLMNLSDTLFCDVSVSYIKELLQPFVLGLNNIETVEAIKAWTYTILTPELSKYAVSSIDTEIRNRDPEPVKIVLCARNAIFQYLVAEIIELLFANGTILLPWDIQTAIGSDPELSKIFGILKDQKVLPVTISIDGNQFKHLISLEFICGLSVMLLSHTAGTKIDIYMSDVLFSKDYVNVSKFISEYPSNYEMGQSPIHSRISDSNFSIIVDNTKYYFDTGDFVQGFATGASWLNVDHRQYWKDLRDRSQNINITF